MKKVLIITYYWPPSGGAGVQRWLKFVKYLREFGWEPVVYTPENPEPPDYDETLIADIPKNLTILKKPIWEPYRWYKKLTGRNKETRINHGFLNEDKQEGILEKISVWIRGNFFIPDARCFWIKPSIKYLVTYLRDNPVDVIVSSGPPHSMHLIALGIKKKLNIPWLADFRDPWTEIDFYDKLRLTSRADRKHKNQEKNVLRNADIVATIGHILAERFKLLGARRVEVITNGYDEDDFSFLPVEPDEHFTITHMGSINKDRNHEVLWMAIAELCSLNEKIDQSLKLHFIGKVDYSLVESLKKYGLLNKSKFTRYLPHREALEQAASSSILLLLINNTPNQKVISTGKIYEYIAMERPILCIGPEDGEAAKVINQYNNGQTFDLKDKARIIKWIEWCAIQKYENSPSLNNRMQSNIFSRRHQAYELKRLLDNISVI